jgi:hypothetical protein
MSLGQPFLSGDDSHMRMALSDFFRRLVPVIDGLTDGRIGVLKASAAMPTAGTYIRGDFVRNSAPAILGTAGARYVVNGWTRLTTGQAHVLNTDWAEARALTGT